MSLADFHFIRPAWLLLAPIAFLIWRWHRQSSDPLRGWRSIMDADLLNAMTVGAGPSGGWRQYSLLSGWLIAVVAIAGPTWKPEPSPFADSPVPLMIVLKADQTMDLSDLTPNRMERARLKVADLAEARRGKPLGLAAYAGSAHLVLPPTRDTSVVASMAAEISPEVMPQPGDNLPAAIRLAIRSLKDTGGSMIVIADTAPALGDADLAEFKQARVPIHFLASARDDTPEFVAIGQVAKQVGGDATLMTADSADVDTLVRKTATATVNVTAQKDGTRWAESGWWLVPVLALITLLPFQRTPQSRKTEVNL